MGELYTFGWEELDSACCSTGPMSTSMSLIGRPCPERRRSALLIRATDPSLFCGSVVLKSYFGFYYCL
jgi:hypothetical protein